MTDVIPFNQAFDFRVVKEGQVSPRMGGQQRMQVKSIGRAGAVVYSAHHLIGTELAQVVVGKDDAKLPPGLRRKYPVGSQAEQTGCSRGHGLGISAKNNGNLWQKSHGSKPREGKVGKTVEVLIFEAIDTPGFQGWLRGNIGR